jgi:type IV pilus biogenesis protein PilP
MRNDRAMTVLMVASIFAWPISALARSETPDPANTGATVATTPAAVQAANELMRLQEDTLLLKAQLKKLDAEAQVVEREEALPRMGRPVPYGDMSLVATQSLGKATSATISSGDGAEIGVETGDMLPNGMHVVSIRSGAIVLAGREGHHVTLTVVSPQQTARNIAAMGAANSGGVPPFPVLPMSFK